MSRGAPTGVPNSTRTLTHGKPYPFEGYGFVEGTGKPMGDLRLSIQKLKIIIQIYNTCLDTNNKTLHLCSPCSCTCCPSPHLSLAPFVLPIHVCPPCTHAHPSLVCTAIHAAIWCHVCCHLLLFVLPWPLFVCALPAFVLSHLFVTHSWPSFLHL